MKVTVTSVQQPWAYCLIYAGKPIENRQRKDGLMPTLCRHRGPIIIHASKGMTRAEERDAARGVHATFGLYLPGRTWSTTAVEETRHQRGGIERWPWNLVLGCTVGIMNAVGHVEPGGRIVDYQGDLDMRWHARGQWGLILLDPEPLPALPLKGQLAPFKLDTEEMAEQGSLGADVARRVEAYARRHPRK